MKQGQTADPTVDGPWTHAVMDSCSHGRMHVAMDSVFIHLACMGAGLPALYLQVCDSMKELDFELPLDDELMIGRLAGSAWMCNTTKVDWYATFSGCGSILMQQQYW